MLAYKISFVCARYSHNNYQNEAPKSRPSTVASIGEHCGLAFVEYEANEMSWVNFSVVELWETRLLSMNVIIPLKC